MKQISINTLTDRADAPGVALRTQKPLRIVAAFALAMALAAAGCNSNQSQIPGPSGLPGSLPGGSSPTPGSTPPSGPPPSGGSSGGSSGQSGGQSGSSGGLPGSSPGSGSSGSSSGSGSPDGSAGGGTAGGGTAGGGTGDAGLPGGGTGLPGSGSGSGLPDGSGSGTGTAGTGGEEGSWEDGLPGGSEDGWQTSNQIPGGEADIPPMPSERGKPPGAGGDGEDGALDGALEDFDGEILSEREVIRKRSNETAGSGGASLPEASAGVPGGSGNADMPDSNGPLGVPSNRNTPPPPSPVASAGVPDDIPDAKDDDIIARQLREAALAETDPELKEKLWDEYRRYKGL